MHVERFVFFAKTTICIGSKSNMAGINTEHVFYPLMVIKSLKSIFLLRLDSSSIMAFMWPSVKDDVALATEFTRERPVKPIEWDKIAESLSKCSQMVRKR